MDRAVRNRSRSGDVEVRAGCERDRRRRLTRLSEAYSFLARASISPRPVSHRVCARHATRRGTRRHPSSSTEPPRSAAPVSPAPRVNTPSAPLNHGASSAPPSARRLFSSCRTHTLYGTPAHRSPQPCPSFRRRIAQLASLARFVDLLWGRASPSKPLTGNASAVSHTPSRSPCTSPADIPMRVDGSSILASSSHTGYKSSSLSPFRQATSGARTAVNAPPTITLR